MIKDNIKNYKNYIKTSELLDAGLEYLAKTDFSQIENGKYQIIQDEVFALVQDYNSKPLDNGKFEAHKRFIDIQFIVKGSEKIGFGEISDFSDDTVYDELKDIVFLKEKNNNFDFVKLQKGDFAIFYPNDAHMPQIAIENSSYVKKVVVKVKF